MGARAWLIGVVVVLAAAPAAMADGVPAPAGSTPALIARAADRGAIDRDTTTLYLAYALRGDPRLPRGYRGSVPWDGTLIYRRVRRALPRMARGRKREAVEDLVLPAAAGEPGPADCGGPSAPTTDTAESEHFYVEYNSAIIGGELDIQDYVDSLEEAWAKEVDDFGWARPPILHPDGLYHVRIDGSTAPDEYGFVADEGTHAGDVGNNPNTPWTEPDAHATCMVLNADFSTLSDDPRSALDSTTAHEFNHSIQYGYGSLHGPNAPDDSFTEGGATWMEDEVQDDADNNHEYLWPDFHLSMGEYGDEQDPDYDPYPYWITFRGLTERYGTGVDGGGEQVMQDFWELNSQGDSVQLVALNKALASRGTTLAAAYHAYAVAVKFNKACGGGYVYPYCLEEGPDYVIVAEPKEPAPHAGIAAVGGSVTNTLQDNYALNWVTLPTAGGPYSVTLAGSDMQGSVACDNGAGIQVTPLPAYSFNPAGCVGGPVGVITNHRQRSDNPATAPERSYTLATGPPRSAPAAGTSQGSSGTGPGDTGVGSPVDISVVDTLAPITRLRVSSRRSLRALLRRGLLIRVHSSETATARADLYLGRRTFSRLARSAKSRRIAIGRRRARFAAPGSKRVRIRLSKRAKRVLRRARRLRLLLRVRVTDAAGNRKTVRRRISVRR